MRDRNGVDWDEMESKEELEGVQGGETVVQVQICYLRKNLFSIKREKQKQQQTNKTDRQTKRNKDLYSRGSYSVLNHLKNQQVFHSSLALLLQNKT